LIDLSGRAWPDLCGTGNGRRHAGLRAPVLFNPLDKKGKSESDQAESKATSRAVEGGFPGRAGSGKTWAGPAQIGARGEGR
jgi:hypothetical protein